jgi:ribosome-associated protein
MNPKKMSALVIDALEDIKAKNILVLNVSKLTSLFDYIVIASGDSNRQTKALANNVRDKLKEAGAHVYGSEGEETGEWVLVDLGDIVVHIMQPTVREYYRLEELWRDGKVEFPKPEMAESVPPVKVVKVKAPPKATDSKKSTATKTTAKKPTVTGTTAKKASAKKPVTEKTTTKKPATKAPVTKKPVAVKKKATAAKATATAKVAVKSTKKTTVASKAKAKPAPKTTARRKT